MLVFDLITQTNTIQTNGQLIFSFIHLVVTQENIDASIWLKSQNQNDDSIWLTLRH